MTIEAVAPTSASQAETPASVQEAPAAPSTPAAPAAPKNRAERRALARAAADRSQAARAPAPVAAAPATPPEPATPPAPAPQADGSVAREWAERQEYEARLAEQSRLAEERAKALEERDARDAARAKMTHLERLQADGLTYEQLTKEIVEGKHTPKTAEQMELEAIRAELAQTKAAQEEWRTQQETQAKEAQRTQYVTQLKTELAANVEAFPVLAAMPWGASEIVRRAEESNRSFAVVAKELEQAASGDIRASLSHEPTLRALLKDPALRAAVTQALGPEKGTPTDPATGPTVTPTQPRRPDAIPSSVAADPGSRGAPAKVVTPKDRVRVAKEAAERAKAARVAQAR